MTVQVFCPKWYYHYSATEEQQEPVRSILGSHFNNEGNFSIPQDWNCKVRTSWGKHLPDDPMWLDFLEVLRPAFDQFINEVGAKQDINIIPRNFWANKYNAGEFQEAHDHCAPNSNIGFVYFYEINECDDCGFKFYNTEHAPIKLQGIDEVLGTPDTQITEPDIKQGDLIMFPAHYLHLVSPHKGTKTRMTVSANFHVVPVPPEKPAQQKHGKDMDLLQ